MSALTSLQEAHELKAYEVETGRNVETIAEMLYYIACDEASQAAAKVEEVKDTVIRITNKIRVALAAEVGKAIQRHLNKGCNNSVTTWNLATIGACTSKGELENLAIKSTPENGRKALRALLAYVSAMTRSIIGDAIDASRDTSFFAFRDGIEKVRGMADESYNAALIAKFLDGMRSHATPDVNIDRKHVRDAAVSMTKAAFDAAIDANKAAYNAVGADSVFKETARGVYLASKLTCSMRFQFWLLRIK